MQLRRLETRSENGKITEINAKEMPSIYITNKRMTLTTGHKEDNILKR
jgi:hypothetical protein